MLKLLKSWLCGENLFRTPQCDNGHTSIISCLSSENHRVVSVTLGFMCITYIPIPQILEYIKR